MGILRPRPNWALEAVFHDIHEPGCDHLLFRLIADPQSFPKLISGLQGDFTPFLEDGPFRGAVIGFRNNGLFDLLDIAAWLQMSALSIRISKHAAA